tara:strand:- start:826 stop:2001 length:1176 start_codon:yes stop_codon:yes gene_type:complete
MAYKKFKSNDLFYNTLEMHPEFDFAVYNARIYLNNRGAISGAHVDNAGDIPTGHVSLYELNVDRQTGEKIYPFINKNGTLSSFKTITTGSFNSDYVYGSTITGSYPLSASIERQFFASTVISRTGSNNRINSLYNTLDFYQPLSRHYTFSSSLGDKGTQDLNLISIPSIVFGSQIKKGSMDLKFYVSGTLVGQLKDQNRNGELIQVGPEGSTGSGSVAGVVLYNEGFVILTGSWNIGNGFAGENYVGASPVVPKWIYFAKGANDGTSNGDIVSSSFNMTFKGTTKTQTITMLAHAQKGELNHSNNPTYRTYDQSYTPITSSDGYIETKKTTIKNIVSSSYSDPYADFKKTTYISSVAIYDENKNLIGIAKLATPVKKTEDVEYTIKMKLDI